MITATKSGTEKNATVFAAILGRSAARSGGRRRQERNHLGARSLPLRAAEDHRVFSKRRSAWPPSTPCSKTPARARACKILRPTNRRRAARRGLSAGALRGGERDCRTIRRRRALLDRRSRSSSRSISLKYNKASDRARRVQAATDRAAARTGENAGGDRQVRDRSGCVLLFALIAGALLAAISRAALSSRTRQAQALWKARRYQDANDAFRALVESAPG